MNTEAKILFQIPDTVDEGELALLRSRLSRAADQFYKSTRVPIKIEQFSEILPSDITSDSNTSANQSGELTLEQRAQQYHSAKPYSTFARLIVPPSVRTEIDDALDLMRLEQTVFYEYNLSFIEPNPRTALNFHGPPGTGKTLAAQAIAHQLGRNILIASYAQIESKFHGDGPKNVEAIFYAAQRDNALLFIDEADSLLSKRLTSVSQGSEQAINSMRSQLLINLEKFRGIVVFATNLVENYDRAFETRVRSIHFPKPGKEERRQIWYGHLFFEGSNLPIQLTDDELAELAEIEDIVGRDIKNAVISAALYSARENRDLYFLDLQDAIERVKRSRIQNNGLEPSSPDEETREALIDAVNNFDESNE